MAEFMEQGPRVVRRQQRWLSVGASGEIADIDNQRRDGAIELLLVAQRGHPGTRTLRGPGEVVAIEQRLVASGAIADFPDPHIRVPDRNILPFREADAEQAGGAVEGGLDPAIEREGWLFC